MLRRHGSNINCHISLHRGSEHFRGGGLAKHFPRTGVIEIDMEKQSLRQENIRCKVMPNGNIRFFDQRDMKGCGELQIQNPRNVAATIITAHEPKIIEPVIAASRGRNTDNPSDRTKGTPCKQRLEIGGNISNTLTSVQKDNLLLDANIRIRKLTQRECFRLMDVDDKYIDKIQSAGISGYQQYKMAGNSIVVNCMYEIFENLFYTDENKLPEGTQLNLF